MRPIVWGLILTVLGAFFWILFSVVFGFALAFSPTGMSSFYWALIYIPGLTMLFSLPITAVIEVYNWLRKRRPHKIQEKSSTENSA
jgi:membrane protein DedA with SNARE-associated domain